MLEKQAGNFNVEKLRIILLFEGDFNQNNKWLGRAVMFNVEAHQQMAKEQYGVTRKKQQTFNVSIKDCFMIMFATNMNRWPCAPTTQKVATTALYSLLWLFVFAVLVLPNRTCKAWCQQYMACNITFDQPTETQKDRRDAHSGNTQ